MSKELIYLTYSLFCIDQIRKYISNDSNTRAEKFTKELMYKIENLAAKYNLKVFVGDWKDFLPKERHFEEVRDQSIVVLRRKF